VAVAALRCYRRAWRRHDRHPQAHVWQSCRVGSTTAPVILRTLNARVSVLVESKTILAESPLPYRLTPLPLTHADLPLLNATPTAELCLPGSTRSNAAAKINTCTCWVCREWGVGGEGRHARRRQVNAAVGQE